MRDFVDINKRINPQDIPLGSVGYYVKKSGHKWSVDFGIVAEHYSSEICLWLLDTVDYRLINGIPVKEFKTPTRWMKLPKGWTYNTELIQIGADPIYDKLSNININISDPESILSAFNMGLLVKVADKDYATFNAEIDNQKGYRIVRNYDTHHNSYVSVNWYQVYKTYEEALTIIDKHEQEMERIANLSDYEWAVEQIDNTLNFYYAIQDRDEEKKRIRDWLLKRDKVEDIEIRATTGGIEWKYWKNKRWMRIEI